jgi:putative flavoprotein involved in K+ transport
MGTRLDAVVIGGGQAGLAASHHLRRLGREHVVLEQHRVAEAWRRRWDSFTLVTPNWSIKLPGASYAGPEPDGFLPRDEIVAHLERYAADAPVRTGIRATAVDRDSPGHGWIVTTSEGPLSTRTVIVATGMFAQPRRPGVGDGLSPRVTSLHTDEYRNPEALPPGGVLIVGSGQSGCQVAEELLEAGRDVVLSLGSTGRMRRRYRGRDSMAWAWDLGFMHRLTSNLESPRERYASNPHVSGKRGGHTLNLHRFAADGITLVGRLTGIDGERATFAPDVPDRLRFADTVADEISKLIDGYIEREGIDAPAPAPDNTDEHAGTEGFEQPVIESIDLRDRGISTVIWAGGFGFDFSWIHAPVFEADGYPITARGVTSEPGLAFLGLAWLYQFKSSLLSGVGDDAAHVVETLAAQPTPA